MRALTAEQRADREREARVRKRDRAAKVAEQAIKDHKSHGIARVLAKNDMERKRIDVECEQRLARWADELRGLEADFDRAIRIEL